MLQYVSSPSFWRCWRRVLGLPGQPGNVSFAHYSGYVTVNKDAYQDSKYCERHMHRGRNRSRKPVEVQPLSQSPSSTVTSLAPAGIGGNNKSGGSSSGNLHSVILAPLAAGGANAGETGLPRLLLEFGSYGMDNKDFSF